MKQDSLHQFSRISQNVSSTTFQSSELLIQCGFIWKETMQLELGKVEFSRITENLPKTPKKYTRIKNSRENISSFRTF